MPKHGMSITPEHKTYRNIRYRYGLPEHWSAFEDFYNDLGPKPSLGHKLYKIDPNKPYERGNCEWRESGMTKLKSMSVGDTFTIKTVQEYNKYFQAANRLGYALKSRELSDDRREITLVSK